MLLRPLARIAFRSILTKRRPMSTDLYLTPEKPTFAFLDCKKAFQLLTPREQRYAHELSVGYWQGARVCLSQLSDESPHIFALLQTLFASEQSVASFRTRVVDDLSVATPENFDAFLNYAATFYGNMGNYLSFGDTKIVPRLSEQAFHAILACAQSSVRDRVLAHFAQCREKIFSLAPGERALGLDGKGISAYYSPGIKSDDIARVDALLNGQPPETSFALYNTRVFQLDEHLFEVRLASADVGPITTLHGADGLEVRVVRGDFSQPMARLAAHMAIARQYAANETQEKMIDCYVESFTTGSIPKFSESQSHWVHDIGPSVETNVGFVETYRDPVGVRAEFEGFVSVVNKETSAKFNALVDMGATLLQRLPWPSAFERTEFKRPDFTSLEVITFASSGVPAGINIPNLEEVRAKDGFKNVSLGNVLRAAYATARDDHISFVSSADQSLYQKWASDSFDVQVGLHELVGHGSGRLFAETTPGQFDFDRDLIDPTTNKPVASWYDGSETYDQRFGAMSSSMEECRAECVGIYLSLHDDACAVFGHTDASNPTTEGVSDLAYINWLIMARAGIRALEFYSPETNQWRQAHMQARFAILQSFLRAGQGFATVTEKTEEDAPSPLEVVLDRSKIATVGKQCIADFLLKLNVYKATGNKDSASAMYSSLCSVGERELAWRDMVMKVRKPRSLLVQAHTRLEHDGSVVLDEFEGSAVGMIESFVARFGLDV